MTDREPQRGAWDPTALFSAGGRPVPPADPADPTVPFDPMTMPMTGAARPYPPPGTFNPMGYGGATPDQLQPVPRTKGYGRLPLIVAALAVLLLVGIVGGVVLLRTGNRADTATGDGSGGVLPQLPATETVATRTTVTESTETPPEAADPQAEALARLETLREQGAGGGHVRRPVRRPDRLQVSGRLRPVPGRGRRLAHLPGHRHPRRARAPA